MLKFILAAVAALGLFASQAMAVAPAVPNSPLGTNLAPVNYYTSEQPFLNIFHTAGNWTTHSSSAWDTNEEQYLNLDSDGYPKTLTTINDSAAQKFTSVGCLLLYTLPSTPNGYYPSGQYVLLYDGQGTMTIGFDASVVSSAPGRIVFNVSKPSGSGLDLRITSTDPNNTGNYIRNIRVVKAENEALLASGEMFNPNFVALIKNFRALRFMDWFSTNGNTLSSWTSRPLVSNAFWGTTNGAPIEVAIALANEVGADAWLNIPAQADNNYVTQMATLIHNTLGTSQHAYIEFSNEVWNSEFASNAYSIAQGKIVFPNAMNQWYGGWEWYGYRVAQISDIFYSVYGATDFNNRIVIVMAGQAGNPAVLQEELSTPDWTGTGNGPAANHHIGAAAIAPYFFGGLSTTDLNTITASSDGGLTDLFNIVNSQAGFSSAPVGGWVPGQTASWTAGAAAVAKTYNIPLVAYEGGQAAQGFPSFSDGSAVVNLFIAANIDPRMATAYTAYFNQWKASGGTMFMHFNDSQAANQYGEWGALTSIMNTTTPLSAAPAKWQAIQNFISSTPCWWTNCVRSGTVAPPSAPNSFSIH